MSSRLWVLAAVAIAACDQTPIPTAARLRGPMDMVVAGDNKQFMYVAGGVYDALYIIDLRIGTRALATVGQFIRSPNKFFPLEVPVGRNPVALATTADLAFVLAVCAADHSLYVVNANTQFVVRDDDGNKLMQELGIGSAGIVADPTISDPAAPFPARFFINNPARQEIYVVEMSAQTADDGTVTPRFLPMRTITNTGTMARIAVSTDGTQIFGADPTSTTVHRVNVQNGTRLEDIAIGGPSLDVAVVSFNAGNGPVDQLYVARPDTFAVEVFDTSNNSNLVRDPEITPPLLDDQAFTGVYLGEIPARFRLIKADESGAVNDDGTPISVTATCVTVKPDGTVDDSSVLQAADTMMVATDSGRVFFIKTDTHTLITESYCVPPTVQALPTQPELFDTRKIFQDCTDGLKRLQCDHRTGVTIAKGQVPTGTSFSLSWEPVIPGLLHDNGGGYLSASGTELHDISADFSQLFSNVAVQPGDRVAILSPARATPECADVVSNTVVTAIITTDDGVALALKDRIDPTCFVSGRGALNYSVTMTGSFLLTRTLSIAEVLGRIRPGESFGGSGDPIRFTLRSDLHPDPVNDAEFTTYNPMQFIVFAPFLPMIGGRVSSSDGVNQTFSPAGRIPTALVTTHIGAYAEAARPFVALVSFAASDFILLFDPTLSISNDATATSTATSTVSSAPQILR